MERMFLAIVVLASGLLLFIPMALYFTDMINGYVTQSMYLSDITEENNPLMYTFINNIPLFIIFTFFIVVLYAVSAVGKGQELYPG